VFTAKRVILPNNQLTQCRTCGKDVARKAWKCPHCGESTTGINRPKAARRVLIALAIFVGAVIISVFGNTL
jgi:predicted RNA-binding Zn-ribbon protein involved in translation (DUF1610 family)